MRCKQFNGKLSTTIGSESLGRKLGPRTEDPRCNRFLGRSLELLAVLRLRFTDHRFLLHSFTKRIPATGLIATDRKTFRPKSIPPDTFSPLNVADHGSASISPVTSLGSVSRLVSSSIYANIPLSFSLSLLLSPSPSEYKDTPRIFVRFFIIFREHDGNTFLSWTMFFSFFLSFSSRRPW